MTQGLRAAWAVRFGLVAVLSLASSGAPRAAAAAAGRMGPCAEKCDGSAGDSGCPPICPDGICAKVVQALIAAAPECGMLAPDSSRPCLCDDDEPLAPPPGDGVFHPPNC